MNAHLIFTFIKYPSIKFNPFAFEMSKLEPRT